jgi:hypothetical protein
LNAAVINIAAHSDPHAANEPWVLREGDVQALAIYLLQSGSNMRRVLGGQCHGAFNCSGPLSALALQQPFQFDKNLKATPRFCTKEALQQMLSATLIEQAIRV